MASHGGALRCIAYTSDHSGLFFMPGVEAWLTGHDRPLPQGTLQAGDRRGIVYYVRTLICTSQQHPEWPLEVREWLRDRGGTPEALVVVWDP
jgi:hypothetical protein